MATNDVTGHEGLTNEQLNKKIADASSGQAAPGADGTAAKATPDPASAKPDTAATAGDGSSADGAAPAGDKGDEITFAGKFKTSDDLSKSTLELADKLDLSPTDKAVMRRAIKEAKAADDWSEVEELYKGFESVQGKRAEAERIKAEEQRRQQADDPDEPKNVDDLDKDAVEDFIRGEVDRRLPSDGVLKARFEKAGVNFPPSMQELKELEESNPYLYDRFMEAFNGIIQDCKEHMQQFFETKNQHTQAVTKVRDEAVALVKAKSDKLKLGLTEDQIKKDVDAILADKKNSDIYKNVHGVQMPKDAKYVFQSWNTDKAEEYVTKAMVEAENRGALSHAEALKKNRDGVVDTASTRSLPGSQVRNKTAKVDLTNEKDVRGLPDADLDKFYQQKIEEGMKG